MAAVTESSAAMGMERRDWLNVALATISRNHELTMKPPLRSQINNVEGFCVIYQV